mgnify:CR=1 FL=1
MTEIRRAIFYSVLNKYAVQLVSFVSIAILARLLTPAEIGVFAVASSLSFVATSLRTFGVGEYLMRERSISVETVKTVMGVMIVMSWGMGALFLFGSPWVAEFYGEPALTDVIRIISVPFFLAPFLSIPFSILSRSMKFDSIMKVELSGCLVRNIVSISLVLQGMSFYGLAWGTLAGVVAEFLMVTYYRPAVMSWLPSFQNFGRVFSAGAQISFSNLCLMISKNSNDLILGRLTTMNDVGIYSRGLGLIQFLNNIVIKAVGPVALPHLSKVKREGGDVAQAYLDSVSLVGAVALPLFAVVNLSAYAMITALFGDQWAFSAELASALSIWAIFQTLHCFAKQGLLTANQERLFLVKELQSLVLKVVLIVVAAPYGLNMVAWAVVASGLVDFLVVTGLMRLALDIKLGQFAKSVLPNLLVATSCWVVLQGVSWVIPLKSMNEWLALLVTGAFMVPVWLISLKLTGNKLWPHVAEIGLKVGQKLGVKRS